MSIASTLLTTIGVDEHVWRHTRRGDKFVTVIIDLTPLREGRGPARLLDMVEGRSKKAFKEWLSQQDPAWRDRIEVVAMDGFTGFKTAAKEELPDAVEVMDPFHVVKLATQAVDEVRRRVQQDTLGHRGLANDPLYKIRTILRSGAENLTLRQQHRLGEAIAADQRHEEVYVAWQCAQRVRDVYHAADPATGRALAEKILAGFPHCPIPEIARLGRTLKQWADAFLGYFRTGGANNGGTEAVNGLIELHRRIARGFRNRENYRLRMLLIAGGLDQPPPQV